MLSLEPDVPQPTRAARDRALKLLAQRFGASKVVTEADACEAYASDESETRPRAPDAVVRAETAEDIRTALSVARDAGVPITPRAAGTGRTGGATPVAGGIVLSVMGLDQIVDIDRREGVAVVEPGVILADLHAATEAEGWFYPPDPNSAQSCAVGGNVAENAGGPRAFKYGVTNHYVLGLEATLIGGQSIFAGQRTPKGVTGYDVKSLLVGSEGTLAVFGRVTLRLVPNPERVMTLLSTFDSARDAARAVSDLVARGITPRCIEFLDDRTLDALRRAGNSVDADARAMLLIEVDGAESACEIQAERVAEACDEASARDVLVASEGTQRERLWAARREMSPAVRRMAKHKLAEDVVVPRGRIGDLLDRVSATSEREKIETVTYGHAGDGNLHVNFLWNDDEEIPAVDRSIERLFRDVVEMGGTLSGEHGIGVLKAPFLHIEQSAELIALQRDLKRTFDPSGLLNPGKIFPTPGHGPC